MAFSEFGRWTEQLFATRRAALLAEHADFVAECDAEISEGDTRLVAFDIVRAALEHDPGMPALTPTELEQARAYNERGAFGRMAIPYFRELFENAERLVAA